MTRWPIRIRLTAGFAVAMALVLVGVVIATVASFRDAFDESIDQAQATRLHALSTTPPVGSATPAQPDPDTPVDSDTATQVLDSERGTVLAGSAGGDGRALLTPAEIATAVRGGELRLQRDGVSIPPGLPGRSASWPAHHPTGAAWRWWPPALPGVTRR